MILFASRGFPWNIKPYLLFLKKQQNFKLSTAANYRWRLKGYLVAASFGVFYLKTVWRFFFNYYFYWFFILKKNSADSNIALCLNAYQLYTVIYKSLPMFLICFSCCIVQGSGSSDLIYHKNGRLNAETLPVKVMFCLVFLLLMHVFTYSIVQRIASTIYILAIIYLIC